ncbi:MAG: 30S ribosomal protein S9 [Cytophagaceae bacterium]|nr:30S ribosomal protein S9 [Cytophagaceae bacterium]MDW8456239.1 30S ribosomal protein S9 [Cytophagaceae bacterium]
MEIINALGRRKTSVARVYLSKKTSGEKTIIVNERPLEEYFPSEILQTIIKQPLVLLNEVGNYSIKANIKGGGFTGQAEALRLALARALSKINPEYRLPLKKEGLLRRDPRMVERKKPGRRKARRRFQFSKR